MSRSERRLRLTSPALTALDLCDVVGGDGIDTVLRTRARRWVQLDGEESA